MADLILVLVIAGFALWGAKRGFISSLIGFTSTIISFVLTSLLYKPFAMLLNKTPLRDLVKSIVEKSLEGEGTATVAVPAATTIVINAIAFIVMILAVKFLVGMLAKIGNVASKIPGIKQANTILGGVIGFVSGLFICYIIIGVIAALGANGTCVGMAESIKASFIASELADGNWIKEILLPVL